MQYINTDTGDYPVTLADIKAAHPLTLFPSDFAEAFGDYAPVQPVAAPDYDSATHKAVELPPVLVEGEWRQSWAVDPLSQQEIDAALLAGVPQSCTPAQGLVALFAVKGITDADVATAIAGIPDAAQRYTAQIGFTRATVWERTSATMQAMAALLGLSEIDLSTLFTYAAGVHV